MSNTLVCPKCGQALAADAPQGLCPACLVRGALDSDPNLTTGPDAGPPLPASGSVLQALRASLPAVPQVQLREPPDEPLTPVNLPGSSAMPADVPPTAAPGRLQLVGEIARGGMGAILKGRDTDLGRDLAVKVLLETHHGKTELAQRFVEEAQIAGQLQHPGIVPVYELGVFPDRRPYFTMKLVRGQTLAALVAARKEVAEERAKFIGIFAQVCQTLAYAHARGVLHRDLKPSNVMVGAFGEVQVMDWGLAKVLQRGRGVGEAVTEQSPADSFIRTRRSEGARTPEEVASQTQSGTVLGTPAYMAPEQARGDVELVDERADVFGLGAVLCQVLTGRPPFTGNTAEAARKAQTAKMDEAFAGLDGCGADAELIALAKACLAAELCDRPRNAGEVAAAVTTYQNSVAERLRQADQERAAAEARATAERQRRRATVAAAAAILALVLVGGGGAAWWWQERTGMVRDVEIALSQAAGYRDAGRWPKMRAALERASGRLGRSGPAALKARVAQAQAEADLVAELEKIRLEQGKANSGIRFDFRAWEQAYAEPLRKYGIDLERLEVQEAAARVRASPIRETLVAALDDWMCLREPAQRALLRQVADGADDNPWRRSFRAAIFEQDSGKLKDLASEEEALAQAPPVLLWLGVALNKVGLAREAEVLLRKAQRRHPGDFWINYELGTLLTPDVANPAAQEGVAFCRAALALRPDTSWTHNALGIALHASKDVDGAIDCFRKTIELDPRDATGHNNLGSALGDKKDVDGAIASFRKALELEPNYPDAHTNLGLALYQGKQDVNGAMACYRKALAIDPDWKPALYLLGLALRDRNDWNGAVACFRKVVELDSNDAMARRDLGLALFEQGNLDEALACFRKVIEIDPKDAVIRANLARTERMVAVKDKLPAFLEGVYRPPNFEEWIGLAQLCLNKKCYRAGARRFAEAFAADPKLAADPSAGHRYNAACLAALAGDGQGEDAAGMDDQERARWRKQALDWLQADLVAFRKRVEGNAAGSRNLVQQRLRHWQGDSALRGLRDREAVAGLPVEEQAACQKLWTDVEALLDRARTGK
jgi:serine/threonine-protein kinase